MKLVLASGNKGKIKEFQNMLEDEIAPYSSLLGSIEIIEDADSFGGNALIKAKTIYQKLNDDCLVISDDSGISVSALGGAPGIYSARYAGEGASDVDNLNKLIGTLKSNAIKITPAYYTAAIAIVSKYGEYVVHGWMHGDVIDEARGDNGFGYDPIFIPSGYNLTLGELDDEIKKTISHRAKALKLAKPIIQMLQSKDNI
jgi:XTP/dITP diphosphohydrolase